MTEGGLPFLPGNSFNDPTKSKYHRAHTLGYKNGYALQSRPEVQIGGMPLIHNQLNEEELDELANYTPTLTYGSAKQAPPEDFTPAHVYFDKKVLKFKAWFQQTVHESNKEHFRVRPVDLYYYLEDDSIAVVEPVVENSGMPQGKLIKRQRLPKNDVGDHWTWKDINLGMNITFYGKVFHIYDCDKWTRDYLESEGIEVNAPGDVPADPYIEKRIRSEALQTFKTPSDFDKLRQFLEMDRKVLRFFCVWDDRDNMFGELRKFVIHYYLVDDTLEVREVHTANDGRDPFPILINRHRVPKDRYDVKSVFPGITMELTEQEIKEYLTPRDFSIGKTVIIYNRPFLIYEVDNFTKAFYWKNFGTTDFTPVDVNQVRTELPKMEVAPYNGYGSQEDSMQSCMSLIPQPPKKDFIKMLENDGRELRFEAVMESKKPEDRGRRFIITYRLSDDMITVYEPPVRNSGIIGGKFLERTRVAKPVVAPERPEFYGPADFYIGAVVEIFRHRFVITNADEFVLKYMEANSSQFPDATVQSLREKLAATTIREQRPSSSSNPAEMRQIVEEVRMQLKKLAITASNRKDNLFLGIDCSRQGFVGRDEIRQLLKRQYLPHEDAIVTAIACSINPGNPDRLTLEDLRRFFES